MDQRVIGAHRMGQLGGLGAQSDERPPLERRAVAVQRIPDGFLQPRMQRQVDAAHERPRVGEHVNRRIGPAGPAAPPFQDFGVVPVRERHIGDHVVRAGGVVRRRLGMHAGARAPGDREQRRLTRERHVRQRIQRELGGGGEAPRDRDGARARERLTTHIGEAIDEARRLKHTSIGTEHLLLGLVREGEGIAAGVLERRGVTLERIRTETIKVLEKQ